MKIVLECITLIRCAAMLLMIAACSEKRLPATSPSGPPAVSSSSSRALQPTQSVQSPAKQITLPAPSTSGS